MLKKKKKIKKGRYYGSVARYDDVKNVQNVSLKNKKLRYLSSYGIVATYMYVYRLQKYRTVKWKELTINFYRLPKSIRDRSN